MHTPQVGRAITTRYLIAAVQLLGGHEARLVRRWFAEESAVLELETEIDGVKITRRYHQLEFRRSHQPLQSDGPAAEGDQLAAPGDGPATRRLRCEKLKLRKPENATQLSAENPGPAVPFLDRSRYL